MQIKYRNGYAEGGFLDDGAVVDGVSGNEVPTGSLESEVRDDIPAQLSEGEFVLPADVVRFIGLDKLMKMRKAAKIGLANMEEEGQIGGSPAPAMHGEMESMGMDDESMEMDALIDGMDSEGFEGAAQNFAQGGSVRGYEAGGVADLPSYETYTGKGKAFGETNGIEYVKYTNKAGEFVDIATLRGNPLRPIPDGFYPVGSTPEEPVVDPDAPVTDAGGSRAVMHKNDPNNPWKGITAPGDSDTIKLHHQLGSDKITRSRMSTLSALAGTTVDNEDQVAMYGMLSDDAKQLFSDRFSDPKGLDAVFTEGKTPAELMVLAQKTADTVRRNKKLPDPGYTGAPTGKTPSLSDLLSGFIPDAEGMSGILKDLLVAGIGIPMLAINIFKSVASKKEVKDLEAFVQDPDVAKLNPKPVTEETTPTTDTATPTSTAVEEPTPVATPEINPQDEFLLKGVGNGGKDNQGAFSPDIVREAAITTGNAFIENENAIALENTIGQDAGQLMREQMDARKYNTQLEAQTAENAAFLQGERQWVTDRDNNLSNTGELAATGVTYEGIPVSPAAEIDISGEDTLWDNIEAEAQSIRNARKTPERIKREEALGQTIRDDDWSQFVEEQNSKPTEGRRKDRMIAQTDIWGAEAKATAAQIEADRLAYLASQSKGGGNTKQDNENAKRAMAKAKAKNVADAAEKGDHYVGGQYGLAEGGLAGKKKPAIKKMRKDSTSGLAAKKKSKERAKAKKGALAAKRT